MYETHITWKINQMIFSVHNIEDTEGIGFFCSQGVGYLQALLAFQPTPP